MKVITLICIFVAVWAQIKVQTTPPKLTSRLPSNGAVSRSNFGIPRSVNRSPSQSPSSSRAFVHRQSMENSPPPTRIRFNTPANNSPTFSMRRANTPTRNNPTLQAETSNAELSGRAPPLHLRDVSIIYIYNKM